MTTSDQLELVSANKSFGGWLKRYKHHSKVLGCEMVFALFLPPAAEEHKVPLLWWLSGLTCTDENFTQKAGAQRVAAELGLAFVCPDTNLPANKEDWNEFVRRDKRDPWSLQSALPNF